jgi:hypothetical protein
MASDVCTLRRIATRLRARLSAGDLAALGLDAAMIAEESLVALAPVLDALSQTISVVCTFKTPLPKEDAA